MHSVVFKLPGYAPICLGPEDFYIRRLYLRIQSTDCFGRPIDCFGRPISSAPDVWFDVVQRYSNDNNKTLRRTSKVTRCLNLGSYNYLGFAAADEYCTPRVIETLKRFSPSTCSPRVDGGTTTLHNELEEIVANFVRKPAAIVFGMGHATNCTTLPALIGKGGLIISDSLNHNSIINGARGSGATIRAYIYLDEAHSIGAVGKTGRGVCELLGVDTADVDVMMGTFTKSFGSCGGYIAGSKELIQYLKYTSPAHLYATSISPPAAQQIISSIKVILGEDGSSRGAQKLERIRENSNFFRSELQKMGFDVIGDNDSPVIAIMLYNPGKIPAFSRECLKQNVAVVMTAFPATPLLLARARICISACHAMEDLLKALELSIKTRDSNRPKDRVINQVGDLIGIKYSPAGSEKQHREQGAMKLE
ncbi:long chain base biosynthesis protein 2a-like [Populus alba x Populus x berolinensis]|nr:long chain base biosynthesis protein 2a-like [Populus alba x Populus x berolinensis]